MDSQSHKIGTHTPGKQSRKYREIGAGRSLVQGPDSPLQKKPRSPLSSEVITSSSSKTNPFLKQSKAPSGLAYITGHNTTSSSAADQEFGQEEFRLSGFSTGSSSSKQSPTKSSLSLLPPYTSHSENTLNDEEEYELFGGFGKEAESPIAIKSSVKENIDNQANTIEVNESPLNSARSSNGSEKQVYGDFFDNHWHSSSLHQLLPTRASSSSYAVEAEVERASGYHQFSPSRAANSPEFGAASSSMSSRHTHLPLPSSPQHSAEYLGTPPQSPSCSRLYCSSPTTSGSPLRDNSQITDHKGKTARLDKSTDTWVKSYLDSIDVNASIPNAIKEVYREYRELQKLADFYSSHDVKVLTADLNSDLAFVQEDLPEELSNEEQKVAIKSLLMKLPELWAEGYFIIPDIKADNIRAKTEEDGTKQAYLFDTHFTQEAIGEDARDIAIQFLSVLQTNLHNNHLTTADIEDILKQFQALKQSSDLDTTLSNAIQTERKNHSFDTFCHTYTEAIETSRIYETEKYKFKLNGEATIIDHQEKLSAFTIIAELEAVIEDLIQ